MKLPAVQRLAGVMARGIRSEDDPRTLEGWSRAATVSCGALRAWCAAAGVRPKAALDFVRLYRAVLLSAETGLRPAAFLDVVDPRTRDAILRRGGLERHAAGDAGLEDFLARQRLIAIDGGIPQLLDALPQPAVHGVVAGAAPGPRRRAAPHTEDLPGRNADRDHRWIVGPDVRSIRE